MPVIMVMRVIPIVMAVVAVSVITPTVIISRRRSRYKAGSKEEHGK
jgi:hypothetical protein